MRGYLRALLLASTALGIGGMALAQSSSPFSGLFGGGSKAESPVKLEFRISGDDEGDLESSITNSSLISGALTEGRYTGQDILAAARGDYARILGVLYDQAYYSAVINIALDGVEAAGIAPLDAPVEVRKVTITVDPGKRFKFSRAAIAPLAPATELPKEYAKGQPAGTGTIKSAAVAGVEGWRDAGHAKADVGGQDIIADHNESRVDSQIMLDPGPAVTFGKLHISGEDRMRPDRLREIAGFPEGEAFNPEKLEDVRKRLRRTGVFSAITLDEAADLGPANTMDVDLTVVEEKPRRIGAGFQLSNTDGALLSAYWMHRNLFGGGERLRFDVQTSDIGSTTSERDDQISARLERPATITADTTAYVETSVARMREEDYDSDVANFSVGFNRYFSDQLTADAAVGYMFSRVTDDNGKTNFKAVTFPMDIIWDKRDEPTNAKRGFYLAGYATPFIGMGQADSGAMLQGDGRGYYSFGTDDKFTLAGRSLLGTILGSDIEHTPREYLFFSGGGGSVRGQSYQSLGVYEITGPDGPIKTGGKSVVNLNAELRGQVRDKIGLAAFSDSGKRWTDSGWSGDSSWQAGAGVGIRYDTPVGPLRFDVGAPLGGGATNDGMQVYLGLGQAF
ncbi:autotransporter assembly complex protein TamA [Paracoccus sp. (in: a-proteobacteria)]|uniref:autotransporter assembly complex protein TamA n=1 Tax=Paracoccus sp. TaxID=267 RepID=UPI003A88F0F5